MHIILSPNSNTKAKHGVTFFVSQAVLTVVLKAPLHAYVITLMSQKLSNMTNDSSESISCAANVKQANTFSKKPF